MNAYRPGFAIPLSRPGDSGGSVPSYFYEPLYSVTGEPIVSSLTGDIMMGRVEYAS